MHIKLAPDPVEEYPGLHLHDEADRLLEEPEGQGVGSVLPLGQYDPKQQAV